MPSSSHAIKTPKRKQTNGRGRSDTIVGDGDGGPLVSPGHYVRSPAVRSQRVPKNTKVKGIRPVFVLPPVNTRSKKRALDDSAEKMSNLKIDDEKAAPSKKR